MHAVAEAAHLRALALHRLAVLRQCGLEHHGRDELRMRRIGKVVDARIAERRPARIRHAAVVGGRALAVLDQVRVALVGHAVGALAPLVVHQRDFRNQLELGAGLARRDVARIQDQQLVVRERCLLAHERHRAVLGGRATMRAGIERVRNDFLRDGRIADVHRGQRHASAHEIGVAVGREPALVAVRRGHLRARDQHRHPAIAADVVEVEVLVGVGIARQHLALHVHAQRFPRVDHRRRCHRASRHRNRGVGDVHHLGASGKQALAVVGAVIE